ncbi:hypothetical protein CKAN_01531800 [Cinnamomum micranthum f. kanehirae]|uniref:Uncharacterized protein n=1 Tax=Cinnamomum micranthum f. kanehirae TaxID=337451 RepID=A0A443P6M1_9MAGN|nr:hypothetical protein CKAN_01531800 [Cinnamomum micranthum f. kanehirae]
MALGFPILLHLLSAKENGGRIKIPAPLSSSDPSLMHLFVLLSAKEMVLYKIRVSWTNGALPVPALQGARIQSKAASERPSSPQSPTSHAS